MAAMMPVTIRYTCTSQDDEDWFINKMYEALSGEDYLIPPIPEGLSNNERVKFVIDVLMNLKAEYENEMFDKHNQGRLT